MAELSGAVLAVPSTSYSFGNGGILAASPRSWLTRQRILGPAVVALYLDVNLDLPPLQAPDIADAFQVSGKYDDRKGALTVVLAEIEEVDATVALLHTQDFARHTFGGDRYAS